MTGANYQTKHFSTFRYGTLSAGKPVVAEGRGRWQVKAGTERDVFMQEEEPRAHSYEPHTSTWLAQNNAESRFRVNVASKVENEHNFLFRSLCTVFAMEGLRSHHVLVKKFS